MAARSSSASLKPERILRITYKELNELAEKLEKHKEMKTKKKAEVVKLNEDCDLATYEKELGSSKNVDDASKQQKPPNLNSEEKAGKKDKKITGRKEDNVKEHKERKKKGKNRSSRQKAICKHSDDEGERKLDSDGEVVPIKKNDISSNLHKEKNENKAAKHEEDKEPKVRRDNLNMRPSRALAKNEKSFLSSDTTENVESSSHQDQGGDIVEKPRGIIKLPQGLAPQTDREIKKGDNLAKTVSFEKNNQADCGAIEKTCTEVHDSDYSRNLPKGQNRRTIESSQLLFDPKNPTRKPALERIAERQKAEGIVSRLQMLTLDKNGDEPVGRTLTLVDLTEKQIGHQPSDMQDIHDKSDIKTEKKIRQLNRQKAKQLIRQAAKPETELRNLLSRDFLKQSTYSSVKAKSTEIQDSYKAVITLDISFAVQNDTDHSLWKNAFYQIIESLRKSIRSFENLSGNEVSCLEETEEIYTKLLEFLDSGLVFYKELLQALQMAHKFDIEEIAVNQYKVQNFGRTVSNHS